MDRGYEIIETLTGWRVVFFEGGEEVGGGVGGPDDYEWLLDQGEEFVGN